MLRHLYVHVFLLSIGTVGQCGADIMNLSLTACLLEKTESQEDYLRIIRFIRFKIMYDIAVESTTSNAIKQNLDGIKKISKERILIELLKILDLQNFLKINESSNLKEIFSMIFPEFLYLKRLDRLKKVYMQSELNRDILLAVLLIDEKDNHEYFLHKYNASNKIIEMLKKFNK